MPRDGNIAEVVEQEVVARRYDAAPHLPPPASEITDDVLRCLIEARALIERGWCQHMLHNDERTEFCAVGAVLSPKYESYKSSALVCLQAVVPEPWTGLGSLVEFNNAPQTTKADVLALFDRAIASRREYLKEQV